MGIVRRLGWKFAEKIAGSLRTYDKQRLGLLFLEDARPTCELHHYTCPLCGFTGSFEPVIGASSVRFSAQCPQCHSRERHRFLRIWMDSEKQCAHFDHFVHFAPEPVMAKVMQPRCDTYLGADIEPGRADVVLDLQAIALPDRHLDGIMANHVLEHVDDARALNEIYRVLRPGGMAILTFPVIHAWKQSYEPSGIVTAHDRHLHFGQQDHVRYFGRDVEARIRAAGLDLDVITASGAQAAEYALIPGDTIYCATRPMS